MKNIKYFILNLLWNAWCVVSIIGIWPRFIEPKLIAKSKKSLPIPELPNDLDGIKILQISDLHFNEGTTPYFLNKLMRKIDQLKPDLIVFTGDLICCSQLIEKERLKEVLSRFSAPLGCYAILGNHDYQNYVAINEKGDYDLYEKPPLVLNRGFRRLLKPRLKPTGVVTDQAKKISLHKELLDLFSKTPFKLLHNKTVQIHNRKSSFNLVGMGEHMLGKANCEEAFLNYDGRYPGIVLVHNPDAIPQLKDKPGNLILCGHTHGGQINLPFLYKKFMCLEQMQFKRGLFEIGDKWVYVNRGLGSVMKFRWFSQPEIALFTLRRV